ncbi:MAG: ATP-binding cassette domain-containing protein [Chloroflexi bacterium]|nr:ATP-binding cassette domain-containing protein [Chloroflexota bacterium]
MIEVENLTKYYGDFLAIENVTFQVQKGEILGFLGPNAAGKTTTMRILAGYMPPSSGTAKVAGFDVVEQSLEARKRIGYMPETVPLYTDMTVESYLDFHATIKGLRGKKKQQRIDEVLDICRLGDYYDVIIGKLSKGYRQRVGIAQAIVHEPEVLILDEPTIGIDPKQVVETRQLIKSLGRDRTVILSSHILPEVNMVCERVIIINEGRVVAVDRPENLSAALKGSEQIQMEVRGAIKEIVASLRELKGVQDVTWESAGENNIFTVDCSPGSDLREEIAHLIVGKGWGLINLQTKRMSLEDIFLKLTMKEESEA